MKTSVYNKPYVQYVQYVITLKDKYFSIFNDVYNDLLQNNIKIDDYMKNYGVFFVQSDKNNRYQANFLTSLKDVANVEEVVK